MRETSQIRAVKNYRNALDTMIAATAEAYDCVVVTDNERDFADVEFINPLRPGAQQC